MEGLALAAEQLPAEWKWGALFEAPTGHEREWRAWLAAAQQAEEEALLRHWAQRSAERR
jgi:hypothetical protein